MSIKSKIVCDGCSAQGPIPRIAARVFTGYRYQWFAYKARRALAEEHGWKHSKGATDYCPDCQEVKP